MHVFFLCVMIKDFYPSLILNLHIKIYFSLVPLQGKNREKEQQKEKEARDKLCGGNGSNNNGHRLVPGSFSSCATCSLCSKTLQKKHGLQCMRE